MPKPLIWQVGADDRITSVNEAFVEYATANKAPHLDERIIGQSTWEHITGAEAEHIYRQLFDRVRECGARVSFDYRCDTPDRRRILNLTIQSKPEGVLDFTSTVVQEFPRPSMAIIDADVDRSAEMVVMCSSCKKVENRDRWLELEQAVNQMGLFRSEPIPRVSHGLCPDCEAEFTALIESIDFPPLDPSIASA